MPQIGWIARTPREGDKIQCNNSLKVFGQFPTALLIYQALMIRYSDYRDGIWASRELLAEDTGITIRTISKATKWLQERGAVIVRKDKDIHPEHGYHKDLNNYKLTGYIKNDAGELLKLWYDPDDLIEGAEGNIFPPQREISSHKEEPLKNDLLAFAKLIDSKTGQLQKKAFMPALLHYGYDLVFDYSLRGSSEWNNTYSVAGNIIKSVIDYSVQDIIDGYEHYHGAGNTIKLRTGKSITKWADIAKEAQDSAMSFSMDELN